MMSPGKWHLEVPKEYSANLRYRLGILERCKSSRSNRRLVLGACREDVLFWINTFVYQFNPDLRVKGPFISWEFQDTAIVGGMVDVGGMQRFVHGILACVEDRRDFRWPKSREIGASWVMLMVIAWLCLYHENVKALVMSRDEDSVDKTDDPDSLFWKVRFLLEHLPDWMHEKVARNDKKMLLKFGNGNSISGEANVTSAGVGGRATVMMIDEFGQFKNGHETYSMTSDTCKCRGFIYTHKDNSGMAFNLSYDPKFAEMREILTHWSMHPHKRRGLYRFDEQRSRLEVIDKTYDFGSNYQFILKALPAGGPFPGIRSPWYDQECLRRTERDVSMNLDIDPRGASELFFDAYRINVLKREHSREPLWQGELKYDSKTGKGLELVPDSLGKLRLWINPRGPLSMPKLSLGAFVDVAAGTGYSPSCVSLVNAMTGEKVAEYADASIYAQEFGTFVVALCSLFEDKEGIRPLLGWEIQGSQLFEKRVRELGYGPIYLRRDEDSLGKIVDNKGRAGWNASTKNILTLMSAYRDALYQEKFINRSADALDECLKLVYTAVGVEYRGPKKRAKEADESSGATVHHGDQVRADAGAWRMCQEMKLIGAGEDPNKDPDWIDPRTMEGRLKLHALQRQESEEWA